MYKKIVSSLYVMNILFQSLYTLALPIGFGALIAFLLTKYTSAQNWVWVVFILLGVFIGLYSMIRFIISASESFKRLEAEGKAKEKEKSQKQKKDEVDGIETE